VFEVVIRQLRQTAGELEPDRLSTYDAARLLDEVATIEKLTGGIKTLLASRAAASGMWRRDGARDEAEWLARKTGTTRARAAETLAASQQVAAVPAVENAVRSGRLSAEQAAVVADAAAADPRCADDMVRRAKRDSLTNLRSERDRVKAAACPDPAERHRRIHAGRYMRFGTDAEGAGTGSWRVTPEVQAELRARLAPFLEAEFDRARAEGRRESHEAYAADALVEMARAASGADGSAEPGRDKPAKPPRHSVPAKVIVRIDHAALVRGHTVAGETCDIGGMPVPVSVVEEMLASGDAFLAAILTDGVDVIRVVHMGRGPNAHQLTALQWRDITCVRVGCTYHPAEWDHREPYSKVKVTTLDNLEGFCKADHDRKSYEGYAVVPSDEVPGKVELVPPEDPALLDTG
jgi:hypothetical protein